MNHRGPSFMRRIALGAALGFFFASASAQTVIDEWASVKTPAAPELKRVTVDPRTTALLMLDFMKQNCGKRKRCIDSLPAVAKFLGEAREKGMLVVYATIPNGKIEDTLPEVAPKGNEPVVSSGPDKFLGTDLEKILKGKGIQTVITVGTAANGAVLYTASGAAFRGMKVIVPVDGVTSDAFSEQITVWQLANGPRLVGNSTMTRFAMIGF